MKSFKLTTVKVEQKEDHFSLALPDEAREAVQKLLQFCFEKRGGFVTFSLSPPRRGRSTGPKSQSHHVNGHVHQIAIETGQPFEDVKKHAKQQAINRGYPYLQDSAGNPVIDFWGNMQGISETDTSVEECKLLIDAIHQLAAELGITLVEE